MNDEEIIGISQDVGVVAISVSVNFGLNPYVPVSWERVIPLVYHELRQVILESLSSTIKTIESTDNDEFLTRIRNPLVSKDCPDLFVNGCCHVGIHNIT